MDRKVLVSDAAKASGQALESTLSLGPNGLALARSMVDELVRNQIGAYDTSHDYAVHITGIPRYGLGAWPDVVDLTGQVAADTIGGRFFSGIGGQVDFIRGASRSQGGRPIIALPSTAKGGTVSRICPVLEEGAGVVTSRGDIHYVVTEYGVADLWGKNIRQRAGALIDIAHPDFRGELAAEARKMYG